MSVTSSIISLATKHLVLNSDLSPNASLLYALPEEIVVRILEWCDVGGVLACQRVGLVLSPRFTTALITSLATATITACQITLRPSMDVRPVARSET
jgi:hypothetical protein